MIKKDFNKAKEVFSLLEEIDAIHLPQEISAVDLVRSDGVIDTWDGSINAETPATFNVRGNIDNYGRYSIRIGTVYLTAEESVKLIDTISSILAERQTILENEVDKL